MNVRGGRFRSTMSGSFAQLARSASANPAIVIRARERETLCKGIQITPRRRGTGRFFANKDGEGDLEEPTRAPRNVSTDFVKGSKKGRRRPAALSCCYVLLWLDLPDESDLETVRALGTIG